jgi:hypothetical protein
MPAPTRMQVLTAGSTRDAQIASSEATSHAGGPAHVASPPIRAIREDDQQGQMHGAARKQGAQSDSAQSTSRPGRL